MWPWWHQNDAKVKYNENNKKEKFKNPHAWDAFIGSIFDPITLEKIVLNPTFLYIS